MGQIYVAEQVNLGREVAVKLMRTELLGTDDARERFLREAKSASQIQHPNAVTAFDFGVTGDGLMYLVMELVEGVSLRHVIGERGPLPWPETLPIIRGTASALASAHHLGVIHRDVKPENILLIRSGDTYIPKLVDFGLAKSAAAKGDDEDSLTDAGTIMGTAGYVAPEAARPGGVGPASDFYGLGVCWFEALTGRPPIEDKNPVQLIMRHVREALPSVRDVLGMDALPQKVDELVTSLLEKEPARRPDVDALVHQLDRLISRAPAPVVDATGDKDLAESTPATAATASPLNDERRVHPRKRLRVLLLKPSGSHPFVTHTRDVSLGGAFVGGNFGNIGDLTTVMFFVDDDPYRSAAKIVRKTRAGIGLQFVDPDDRFLEALAQLLDAVPDA